MKAKILLSVAFVLALMLVLGGCSSSTPVKETTTTDSGEEESSTAQEEVEVEDDELDFLMESGAQEESPTYELTDGPIFFSGTKYEFTLTLYSLKDGNRYSVFSFSNPKTTYQPSVYSLTIDPLEDGNFFHEQLFDSKLERMAVNWTDYSDRSEHVGWVDRDGNLTDITNKIHPTTSGFSSVTPNDSHALFTSDDLLVFYDNNQDLWCYYDDAVEEIVDTYRWDKESDPRFTSLMYFLGLNADNHPTSLRMLIDGDYYYIDNGNFGTEGFSRDYVVYPDGVSVLEVACARLPDFKYRYAISHFGKGITNLNTGLGEPAFYGYGSASVVEITPQTEYIIENLAYSNEEIVFTARRGTERSLFKFSYVNRVAGEPELVTEIDYTWGDIFFWVG